MKNHTMKWLSAAALTSAFLMTTGCEQQDGGTSFDDTAATQPAQPVANANADGGDEAVIERDAINPPGPSMQAPLTIDNIRAARDKLRPIHQEQIDAAYLLFANMNMTQSNGQSKTTGELFNNSEYPLNDLMIIATFHDAKGMFVSKGRGFPDISVLAPGQSSTFEVFGDWDPKIKEVRLIVRDFSTEDRIPSYMIPGVVNH